MCSNKSRYRDFKMKNKLSKLCVALFASALIATPALAEDKTVSTEGSTSVEYAIGILGEAFMEANDGVNFTYNPTGSGAGIAAVSEGRCDIGLSSRGLKEDELKTLVETEFALDGIVVVVNPNNPITNLSIEQINQIYTGKITNWKDLGGADKPIVLIGREAGSGTRDGFESVVNAKDSCKYRQELTSTGDVITTVSKNENAVGYASLAAVSEKIKALTVDGIAASEKTIQDGSYKLQRPFVFVTVKGKELNPTAKQFYDFALSKDAHDLIKMAGVVPVDQK